MTKVLAGRKRTKISLDLILDILSPYPRTIFCSENVVCFKRMAYIKMPLRLFLISEVITLTLYMLGNFACFFVCSSFLFF